MNEYDIKRLALIFAKQAEIEGMKSDNLLAEQQGYSPPYSGETFMSQAQDLESIANLNNEQL